MLAVLAFVVVVSGCTGSNDEEQNAADRSISCSGLTLEIAYADAQRVTLVNLGENSFGNVTVTWNYENGDTIQKEFETPPAGERKTYESGETGTLSQADVTHQECPSKNDSA